MNVMTPMRPLRRRESRRWLVAVYRHRPSPRFASSANWGGRWQADGSISRGVGFHLAAFGLVVEVIVWPRSVVLYSEESRTLDRSYRARVS
jgi:hypothetical protein